MRRGIMEREIRKQKKSVQNKKSNNKERKHKVKRIKNFFYEVNFLWTETLRLGQKKQDIFQKKHHTFTARINDIFWKLCPKTTTISRRDPKRSLIKENQEQQYQETLKTSKNMKQIRDTADARRKKQETKHRRREGSKKKDTISSGKIDHRKILIFLKQKNRDGDEEKKRGKEEVWKQRDQEQKGEIEKWVKTRRG